MDLRIGGRYIHKDGFEKYQIYRIIDAISPDGKLISYTAYRYPDNSFSISVVGIERARFEESTIPWEFDKEN